jgi:hypothetical protein
VDDPEFVELLKSLNDKVSIPSARTISRDVQEVFEGSQESVKGMLRVRVHYPAVVLFVTDGTEDSGQITSLY